MTDKIQRISIAYNSDTAVWRSNIRSAFMEFAGYAGLTCQFLTGDEDTSIRCKFIHPNASDDYMVWYIAQLTTPNTAMYIYTDFIKDTNTASSTSGVNGAFDKITVTMSTSHSAQLCCIRSLDSDTIAFGFDDAIRYIMMVGKEVHTSSPAVRYVRQDNIVYYDQSTNYRTSLPVPETLTDREALIMIKAYNSNTRFIANSAYFPLMNYGTSQYYDVVLSGKTYFVTETAGSTAGRIAFEI